MSNDKPSVCIIGLGYIGLPTAAVVANKGMRVFGCDVSEEVVETVNAGKVHIVEPELDGFVRAARLSGNLTAHNTPQPADYFVIAVPTPFKDDHVPDLSFVEAATKAIAPVLQAGNTVLLESTSPVGATESVRTWLADARPDLSLPQTDHDAAPDVHVAYCPERVLPGKTIRELVENDRVVGGLSAACTEQALGFYRSFVQGQCIGTTARTAEMCKLVENAFRDVNIAFANELSLLSHDYGVDVWELIELANRHPRVNILRPGSGVGGHCIAVDPWFIASAKPELARLIQTSRNVNDQKPDWVLNQICEHNAEHPKQPVALFGLAFKENIDDLRESPALQIATDLADAISSPILIVEPNISELPSQLARHDHVQLVNLSEIKQRDAAGFVLVRHQPFLTPEFRRQANDPRWFVKPPSKELTAWAD